MTLFFYTLFSAGSAALPLGQCPDRLCPRRPIVQPGDSGESPPESLNSCYPRAPLWTEDNSCQLCPRVQLCIGMGFSNRPNSIIPMPRRKQSMMAC